MEFKDCPSKKHPACTGRMFVFKRGQTECAHCMNKTLEEQAKQKNWAPSYEKTFTVNKIDESRQQFRQILAKVINGLKEPTTADKITMLAKKEGIARSVPIVRSHLIQMADDGLIRLIETKKGFKFFKIATLIDTIKLILPNILKEASKPVDTAGLIILLNKKANIDACTRTLRDAAADLLIDKKIKVTIGALGKYYYSIR